MEIPERKPEVPDRKPALSETTKVKTPPSTKAEPE